MEREETGKIHPPEMVVSSEVSGSSAANRGFSLARSDDYVPQRKYEIREDDAGMKVPQWNRVTDAAMISDIIDLLSTAIEYQCGYIGRWKDGPVWVGENLAPREGYSRIPGKVAHEAKHAIVHLTEQYCVRVDRMIRGMLGDFYNEWEQSEDRRVLPNDVLF